MLKCYKIAWVAPSWLWANKDNNQKPKLVVKVKATATNWLSVMLDQNIPNAT